MANINIITCARPTLILKPIVSFNTTKSITKGSVLESPNDIQVPNIPLGLEMCTINEPITNAETISTANKNPFLFINILISFLYVYSIPLTYSPLVVPIFLPNLKDCIVLATCLEVSSKNDST